MFEIDYDWTMKSMEKELNLYVTDLLTSDDDRFGGMVHSEWRKPRQVKIEGEYLLWKIAGAAEVKLDAKSPTKLLEEFVELASLEDDFGDAVKRFASRYGVLG